MSTAVPAPPSRGFAGELRDAVTLRAFALVTGVFLLQMGFILSYIAAFHDPTPHRVPIAVAGPAAGPVTERLNGLDGEPVDARTVPTEGEARRLILERDVDAALIPGQRGRLLVASAAGPAVTEAVARIVHAASQQPVQVTDIRPPDPDDARGLSSFYLVIGWMVGGYLAAAILGLAGGARPATGRRTVIRLGSLALYAVVSGLGGAIIAGPVLGALEGGFVALWGIGALIVFAAAAATMALQVLLGVVGIGVAILLFVVLGNPSAGGAYATTLLPPFWAAVGDWLPTGAGTTAVRNTVYFDGNATTRALLVLAAYAVAGTAAALAFAFVRRRNGPDPAAPES